MATKTSGKSGKSGKKAKKGATRSGGLPLFPILVGAVVVLGVVAVILVAAGSGGGNNPDISEETAAVTVDGTALETVPDDGSADPAIGTTAPTLTGVDFDGNAVEIGPDGNPKAVMFVAHWCPHCRNEVPRLNSWLDSNDLPDDVEVYLVPTNTSPDQVNYPPSQWLDDAGVSDLPTLVDSEAGEAWSAYGAGGFPYMVLLDGDNVVAGRVSGELPDGSYDRIFTALANGETVSAQGGAASG